MTQSHCISFLPQQMLKSGYSVSFSVILSTTHECALFGYGVSFSVISVSFFIALGTTDTQVWMPHQTLNFFVQKFWRLRIQVLPSYLVVGGPVCLTTHASPNWSLKPTSSYWCVSLAHYIVSLVRVLVTIPFANIFCLLIDRHVWHMNVSPFPDCSMLSFFRGPVCLPGTSGPTPFSDIQICLSDLWAFHFIWPPIELWHHMLLSRRRHWFHDTFHSHIESSAASCKTFLHSRASHSLSLYSSVAERQSCKLKVLGSIPSGGCLMHTCVRHLRLVIRPMAMHMIYEPAFSTTSLLLYVRTPTVGLEPTTTRLRALRSTDWARRAW